MRRTTSFFFALASFALAITLVGCGSSAVSGNGGSTGTATGGVFQGTWSGNASTNGCVDTSLFATNGYCAQLNGRLIPISLEIVQGSSTTASPCIVLSNVQFLGDAQGGCGTSAAIAATIGTNGHLTFSAILPGTASSPFNTIAVNITSWDSAVSSTNMTGTFAATVTSSSLSGSANMTFALSAVTQTSTSALFNPLGPSGR